MRSVCAILLPVLIGAVVYAALAVGARPSDWEQSSTLILPAMLIGIMLVALVFLPIWSVLVHKTTRARLAFLCVGAAILLLACGALTVLGAFDRSGGIDGLTLLFVPGLVLVTTFGILMDPRRVRGGEKQRPIKG
jgi:peptidoglycan/LPS O-acetylase OafA/YrhL